MRGSCSNPDIGCMILAMRRGHDDLHWHGVSLAFGILGLILGGLLVYAGVNFVIW